MFRYILPLLLFSASAFARTDAPEGKIFYVDDSGCDSVKVGDVCDPPNQTVNDCLTEAIPCKSIDATIRKAQFVYDYMGSGAEVRVANGTYNEKIRQSNPFTGGGVYLRGNCTDPGSVVINGVDSSPTLYFSKFSDVGICGFTINNAYGGHLIYVAEGTVLHIDSKMKYGSTTACHLYSDYNALLFIAGDSIIEGNFGHHWCVLNNGVISDSGHTITFNGNYTMNEWANGQASGVMNVAGNTYAGGTMTGYKYAIYSNAVMNAGGGASSLPGTISGTSGLGGVVQ